MWVFTRTRHFGTFVVHFPHHHSKRNRGGGAHRENGRSWRSFGDDASRTEEMADGRSRSGEREGHERGELVGDLLDEWVLLNKPRKEKFCKRFELELGMKEERDNAVASTFP